MSQPSRPRARGPVQRRRHALKLEGVQRLEERCVLAPFLSTTTTTATFTAFTNNPPNTVLGSVSLTAAASPSSAAPLVSVAELTPISEFGNNIVRLKAGPGGDFGKALYAITRGAGENAQLFPGTVSRPGVIYRVDPATGKPSVFFDLNTVISQLEPGGNAGNSLGVSTGLVNWYDISFDPEGYFDGRPSMFVSSVDLSDPNKNAIYRIAPDGTFMGAFTHFTDGAAAGKFTRAPSAIFVPPPEQQKFLRGLFSGEGVADPNTGLFEGLFFDANQFVPGTDLNSPNLPPGVNPTDFFLGPQVGFTAANSDYTSPDYAAFTDFGTPPGPGIPAVPGPSSVQGLGGELLPEEFLPPPAANSTAIDTYPVISSNFRRFQDIAFDQYGYFSYGFPTTVTAGTNGGASTVTFNTTTPFYAGSVFVSDLANGLAVAVTASGATNPTLIPVQGPGTVGILPNGNIVNTTGGLGGRIVRIAPNGLVTPFAEGFHVSNLQTSQSFVDSELSITFSADGTTLWASDDDGIWQFKSVASLAGSTSGTITGLNDLRTLGVPYEGQDSAIAVLDTGVDATTPQFRGRVSAGTNVLTNGTGNDDTSAGIATNGTTNGNGLGGVSSVVNTGTGGGGGGGGGNTNQTGDINGHGTPLAGVIAQFVPQATLEPVNIFAPGLSLGNPGGGGGGGGGGGAGGGGTNANGFTSLGITTNDAIYNGFNFINSNPFVADPVRPNTQDRVVATAMGFGTLDSFNSEGVAFRKFPQIVIAFKNQLKKMRTLGIQPIAAAGQFGEPVGQFATPALGQPFPTFATGVAGDVAGMALPATLNEVISVTGTYPFPFSASAATAPIDPTLGAVPRPIAPVLVAGQLAIGGTGTGTGGTTGTGLNSISNLTAGDGTIYSDKVLASVNRNSTTDFAAPALDVPTFRRVFVGDGNAHNVFQEAGTSLSAGIVTGSFALTASAIDYWAGLNNKGVTVDGYLTTPVGARVLNFGAHSFPDLSVYANPDGINSILQWTAVPVDDKNIGGDVTQAPMLIGSAHNRQYSRIDVGNAIAAIEGYEAINWLENHGIFNIIDANQNGLITAQEVQNFVDNSTAMGMPEAGAMARLLGGTARAFGNGFTSDGERPDQPDALQRRFNFFDYAADGQLNGVVSVDQFKMLAHTLLPPPDAFVVTDRQRASGDGYLLNPAGQRNYRDLMHLQPSYEWVPKGALLRWRNISPARFKVNRRLNPENGAPVYTLFHPPLSTPNIRTRGASKTPGRGTVGSGNGANTGTDSGTGSGSGSTTGLGSGGGGQLGSGGGSGSGSASGSGSGSGSGGQVNLATGTGSTTATGATSNTSTSSNNSALTVPVQLPGQTQADQSANAILTAIQQLVAASGKGAAASTTASNSTNSNPNPPTPAGTLGTPTPAGTMLSSPQPLSGTVTITPPANPAAASPTAGVPAATSSAGTGTAAAGTTTTPTSSTTPAPTTPGTQTPQGQVLSVVAPNTHQLARQARMEQLAMIREQHIALHRYPGYHPKAQSNQKTGKLLDSFLGIFGNVFKKKH